MNALSISGQTNRDLCPVLALHIYLTTFNPKMGPFFQFQDGSPVKHSFVAGQLSHILKFLGLDPKYPKVQILMSRPILIS
jgi:hypothetical protein